MQHKSLRSNAAGARERVTRKPSLPRDAIETPARIRSTPVRGLSEFSAALRSHSLDEAWFSANREDEQPAIAQQDGASESPRRKEQTSSGSAVSGELRRYDNLTQLGTDIVRQVAGGAPDESWRDSNPSLHPKKLTHSGSDGEREPSSEARGERGSLPASPTRAASRGEFASRMPPKPTRPRLIDELRSEEEVDFGDPRSPEAFVERFVSEPPELVIPGSAAAAKVDVPSARDPEDFDDIFDALAGEIQRAYRRFYGD